MAVRPQDSISHIGPCMGGQAITPSDSTTYSPPLRGIYVGTTGDLRLVFAGGDDVVYPNVAAGFVHPFADVVQVMSTNTTASDIVGGQ